MSLSKVAITRLRQVKRAILAEPNLYNQSEIPEYSGDVCGTPCCIAGWLVWLNTPTVEKYKSELAENGAYGCMLKYLPCNDDTDLQALYVDYPYWPGKFAKQYEEAKTSKERADVAAARIEHFIETGGRE